MKNTNFIGKEDYNMITLYTTNCPKCKILEEKMVEKNINYDVVTSVNVMKTMGFYSAPILEVDGKFMKFAEANNWINEQEG